VVKPLRGYEGALVPQLAPPPASGPSLSDVAAAPGSSLRALLDEPLSVLAPDDELEPITEVGRARARGRRRVGEHALS